MSVASPLPIDVQNLHCINLFQDLTSTELVSICQAGRLCQVKQGAFFFHQGNPANTWYLLLEGQVKMIQLGLEGHQVLVRMVAVYEEFGAVALLSGLTYPLAAQAAEDCRAIAWDRDTIAQLLSTYPPLALNALRLLSQRFRELQERYRELATERVEQRVARALLRLEHQAGRRIEQGILIDLSLSRQDLAEMTGTTLYTVSRILSQWEQHGLVKAGREKVIILDLSSLRVIAEDLPPNAPAENLFK
ncbi:MAG: Crp/Fnr family transcriptional regulator [Anaerolineae bacterium]|nr:Crp/Fnr family transcriptional regulator [Anaerolineae bacterium]